MGKLKLEPRKQKLFRINQEIDDMKVQTKIVCVYEYEDVEEQEGRAMQKKILTVIITMLISILVVLIAFVMYKVVNNNKSKK